MSPSVFVQLSRPSGACAGTGFPSHGQSSGTKLGLFMTKRISCCVRVSKSCESCRPRPTSSPRWKNSVALQIASSLVDAKCKKHFFVDVSSQHFEMKNHVRREMCECLEGIFHPSPRASNFAKRAGKGRPSERGTSLTTEQTFVKIPMGRGGRRHRSLTKTHGIASSPPRHVPRQIRRP